MNERQKEIINILLSQLNEYLLVQDLAETINCSEKTVRTDLKVIESYITEESNGTLIRKPGLGVCLTMEEHERTHIFNQLHLTDDSVHAQSDEQRIIEIAYDILMNSKNVTVQDLASRYFVNKAVIRKDLLTIEKWLQSFQLTLVVKQKVGLIIEGDEKQKRTALARLPLLLNDSSFGNEFIKTQFSFHEVEIIRNELKALQNHHSLYFTDETFENLLIHTLLSIKRTKLKEPISITEKEKSSVEHTKEYQWTVEFLKKLEPIFTMRFPKEEVIYLTLHIMGGKFRYHYAKGSRREEQDNPHPLLAQLLEHLIQEMSNVQKVDFAQDQMLREGLYMHLSTTLNRLEYGLSVNNPLLHKIKKMYPYLFDTTISLLEEVNQLFSLSIPEEEAAYLTLHFQASIERLRNQKQKMNNIVIVCHMGIGMSQLLKTKIERKFQYINVIACLAKADVAEYISNHEVDFVISTIPLPELPISHIVVSPLLEPVEEKKLETFCKKINEPVKNEEKESSILMYTNPFLVFLQQEAEHRYKVIEYLGNILYNKGFVEKEYVHNAIKREQLSATTIGAGIAIPHGNPKFIKESAIAIATLKEPIEWGTEKVSLVFMLAIQNEEQEVTRALFRELSHISENPAFIQKLTKEKNVIQFLSHLSD
ncbi:BglG family transcription antiterminator [Priestia megaterium]|nr:BglG family transcription antiterminator [Priestia megaterium]